MRWAHPQVAGPKPRLYHDFLHQNTESSLLRAESGNQLKAFEIIREVARPCRFGLTSKPFVDFGSHKTNPKISLSGVAVQTVFAACWEEQDDLTGRRKKKVAFRNAVPLLPAPRASQGRHPCSRHSSLTDPSKEMTYTHLPPCMRGAALGAEGLKAATHSPAFVTSPEDWVGDGFPLTCPCRQLY